MPNPYDQAHALARSVKESDEFQQLKELQEQIEAEDTSKRMLNDFRQQQMQLQMKQMQGEEITEADQEQFNKLIDTIKLNPSISRMLDAEQRFGVVMEDIMKIVMEPTKEIYKEEDE